ncbi:MAG: hypothetical protein CMJ78_20875 [Planctomycetaceae bacterium]|nr:hypothetical protein [Planctomycetaceae bacterium]
MDLDSLLREKKFTSEEIDCRRLEIRNTVLDKSRYVTEGNFERIHNRDLERLYELYDERFFDDRIRATLAARGEPISFRLSSRMTRMGGKTVRTTYRIPRGRKRETEFEIAISETLLFQTFEDIEREVVVNGVTCRDRLDAMQRILEHELIHLGELLIWNDSDCNAHRFSGIAARLFAHTHTKHQLVTQSERALKKFGITPGSNVRFRFDGIEYHGVVNRITKRATVLVEDRDGELYSDGKRYQKFYIPLGMLETT